MKAKMNGTVMAIFLLLFIFLFAGASQAQFSDSDNDYPNGLSANVESTRKGNPLDEGDEVYSLRFSHRLFSGDLDLEAGIGYAEPTSALVRSVGPDAELLLLDLSVVKYLNYEYLNRLDRKGGVPWHRNSRFKPELFVFGGPGWASLRVKDALPSSPLSDASKDFFTVNFGFGAKFHWFKIDDKKSYKHVTSRWFLRPELRARWFTGSDGEIDWGIGLGVGYSFGYRPSRLSLYLKAELACKDVDDYLSDDEMVKALDEAGQNIRHDDELYGEMVECREGLEDLKARLVICGDKCADYGSCLGTSIERVNDAMAKLRPKAENVD